MEKNKEKNKVNVKGKKEIKEKIVSEVKDNVVVNVNKIDSYDMVNNDIVLAAGNCIRMLLFKAIEVNKIGEEEIKILLDKDKVKELFGIRYSLIIGCDKNRFDMNGRARYGKDKVKIKDKEFYVCNDLYMKNLYLFEKWILNL